MTITATEARAHSHYFKDVRHLDYIDVYRVALLFEVDHPALQHALKKILAAGKRGAKDAEQDAREAIDSLNRFLQMVSEDSVSGVDAMRQVVQGAQSTTLEDGSVLTATAGKAIDGGVFEFWWAEHMPKATQAEAWREWIALSNPVQQEPADPHAELRATWNPGQKWQFLCDGMIDWEDIVGPLQWSATTKYRRHPDDVDQEKPWVPDDSGEWVEVPDDCMECPIELSTKVFVLLRCDRIKKERCGPSYAAGDWGWDVDPQMSGRIVAYKVVA